MRSSDRQPVSGEAEVGAISAAESRARERSAAVLLGWFHLVLAAPVLGGVWFSDVAIDRVLSLASALAFAGVGAFFLWLARRLARAGRAMAPR